MRILEGGDESYKIQRRNMEEIFEKVLPRPKDVIREEIGVRAGISW